MEMVTRQKIEFKFNSLSMLVFSCLFVIKLQDLGYKAIVDVDLKAVDNMKWFDALSGGKQHTDFFANRVTNYSKGHVKWEAEDIF